MNTLEAIAKRVSVRAFNSDPVDKTLIEKLIDAGRMAPTARGVEPWEFVVVTDKASLKRLGSIASTGTFIKDAACCIAVFCNDTKYYLEDGCAATENILIAVSDLGLGACWVAGDKKPYTGTVSDMLGASSSMKLISLIAVGWPEGEIVSHGKRPLEDVIHWEKYQEKS
ncbi:nitroreductase family protein [Candidatus Omnitrophota bacterium]